jgi:S1-C subfamily serine protease
MMTFYARNRVWLIVLFSSLTLTAAHAPRELIALPASSPADVNSLKPGVVKIRTEVGTEGSGFIVAIDGGRKLAHIVTAAHVVDTDPHPKVTFYNSPATSVPAARIYKQNLQRDGSDRGLALLWVYSDVPAEAKALPLYTAKSLASGEKVSVLGSPRAGVSWSVIDGSITGLDGSDIVFSGGISSGISGGPVIKDSRAVVGMVTATGKNGINNVAIPATQIRDFLKGVEGAKIPFIDGLPPSANRLKCIDGDSAGCLSYVKELEAECAEKIGKQYPSCVAKAKCWRERGFELMKADEACDENKPHAYHPVRCIQFKEQAAQRSPKYCDSLEVDVP